jgi:prepilin-type N-terminal cleavage/methylation domain-containing protein
VKKTDSRKGFTLVEVMIAVFLVGVAATIVYTEMLMAYRILMRSRARLEAQSIAFDRLWEIYNQPRGMLPQSPTILPPEPTPADCILSTNGIIDCLILAEVDPQITPDPVRHWDIVVEVWAPTNSPLQLGTNSLARYAIRRYWGAR